MLEIVLFVLFFVGYIALIDNTVYPFEKSNKIVVWTSFVVLFVLAGFRDFSIHNDTIPYVQHFLGSVPSGPFWKIDVYDRFEPGYQMYENFLHLYISDNPVVFNVISALLVLVAFYAFSYKYCEKFSILIILYFLTNQYLTQIGVLRQSFAVIFFYGMYISLDKKKYILSILFIYLAYCMHRSSMLLALLYVCFSFKPNKRNIRILIFASLVVFFAYSSLITGIIEDSRYLAESEAKGFFNLTGLTSFVNACVYLFIMVKIRSRVDWQEKDDPMYMVSILYCVVTLLSIRIWIFVRFSMFFMPIILIYLSNLLGRYQEKRYLGYLIIYVVMVFFLLLYVRPEWYSIYPYRFVDLYNLNPANI